MEEKQYSIDVFISYKHAELDMMVSNWLQKNIERYHIPKDIQVKSGKKKIKRVFRDVEDLSVGNDLKKEIENQLMNSEFLIVVCSPEAKQSEWVNREIRTFLKYHDIDNILPIIIKGEPNEAFPDALLQSGEPFAADVRAETKANVLTKLKTEYIRLVAPILYCSYDELVQRHKRYRYQRLLAISAVVLVALTGFTGYALFQNYRIYTALRTAQIAQSKYLTDQAEELYASHDYVNAVDLYLQALPNEEDEKPIVPRALYDLTKALNLFQNHLYDPEMAPFKSNYKMDLPDTISTDFIIDHTGEQLIAYDSHTIYICNTELNVVEKMLTFEYGDSIQTVAYNEEDNKIYAATPRNLFCFDCMHESQLWRVNTIDEIQQFLTNSNMEDFVLLTNTSVTVVNPNGKVKERRFIELPENVRVSNKKGEATLLMDNNTIIFIGETDEAYQILYRYDIQNDILEECTRIEGINEFQIGVYDASTYYVISNDGSNYIYLSRYSIDQKEPMWVVELNEKMAFVSTELFTLESGKEGIFCGLGRTAFVIDADSGKAFAYESVQGDIAKLVMLGNNLHILTKNGEFKYLELNDALQCVSVVYLRKIDCDNIDEIVYANKNGYEQCFVQTGNEIYQYDTLIEDDPNLKSTDIVADSIDSSILENGVYAILSDRVVQYKIGEEIKSFTLPEDSDPQKLLVANENEIDVLVLNENSREHFIYRYDLNYKSYTLNKIEKYFNSIDAYVSGEYVYSAVEEDSIMLNITNLLTDTTKSYEICPKSKNNMFGAIYVEDAVAYYLDEYNLKLHIFDIEKNSMIRTIDLGDWTRASINSLKNNLSVISVDSKKQIVCVPNQQFVCVYDKFGKRVIDIPYKNDNNHTTVILPQSYISSKKNCVYIFSKDEVSRVSLKDYSIQKEVVDFDFSELENQEVSFYEKNVYLNVLSGKNLLMLMDSDLFGKTGYVEKVEAVDINNNKIYVYSNKELKYYKFYSFDEMLKLGKERIEGKTGTW